ncbi:MAG: CaiB/BaiF CoA transferase family protein [Pigmentiphaga sp.]
MSAEPPLHGLRVLDFSQMMAGPLATMLLGDFGADVLKIEPPAGDPMRRTGETRIGGESEYYLSLNRNKRSVVLDLKSPEGLRAVQALAREADIVVENFRPGAAERLGIGYESLRALNPRLIYCSLTGFGTDSVHGARPALDPVIQAMSGIMQLTGTAESGPLRTGFPVSDFVTPLLAVCGILAAVTARQASGQGRKVELSMLDATIFSMLPREGYYFATGEVPHRSGNGHYQIAPYNSYRTTDGREIFLIGHTDAYWQAIVQALGDAAIAADERFTTASLRHANRQALDAALAAVLGRGTLAHWRERLAAAGALFSVVRTWDEVFEDPEVRRNMVVDVAHPMAGNVRLLGNPIRFDGAAIPVTRHPPQLGEHSGEVLAGSGWPTRGETV